MFTVPRLPLRTEIDNYDDLVRVAPSKADQALSQTGNEMKMNVSDKIRKAALMAGICLATSVGAFAQPNPGGPGTQGSGLQANGQTPVVPFDGGMSLMLAASGIGFVAKRMRKRPEKE